MPMMQNIVLEDAQATPVSHTFLPVSLVGNVGTYQDQSESRVADWPVITGSYRPASKTNAGQKAVWKLVLPHALDDNGACCPDVNNPPSSWFTIEVVRNKVATNAQNADLIKYLQELVFNDQFLAVLSGQSLR